MSGCLVIVVGLPLAQVVRHKPATFGEKRDGIEFFKTTGSKKPIRYHTDFTASEAMKLRSFWLISLGHACSLLTVSVVMVHLVPHLTEGLGYSLKHAGYVMALLAASLIIGQVIGGYLGDKFDKRVICTLCMLAHAVGIVLVTYANSVIMVVSFAIVYGVSWGFVDPIL